MRARPSGADAWSNDAGLKRPLARGVLGVSLVSLFLWLMPVAYALFAMLLIDVAVPGRSGSTLAGLSAVAVALIGVHAGLLVLRRNILASIARIVDHHAAAVAREQRSALPHSRLARGRYPPEIVEHRGLDRVRALLTGSAAPALIDACALPFYVLVIALMGWPFALLLIVAAVVAAVLLRVFAGPLRVRAESRETALADRDALEAASAANRDLIKLLGMVDRVSGFEAAANADAAAGERAFVGAQAALAIAIRILLGLALAGTAAVGVWLAIDDRARVGTIVAALLLTGFALWPAWTIAAQLHAILAGRAAWQRIRAAVVQHVPAPAPLPLPVPTATFAAEQVAILVPGENRPLLRGINCETRAGDMVVVVGPAGIGKSVLLRVLAGALPCAAGAIRMDGSTLDQWDPAVRALHIGYMPQSPMLLAGTVAQNIARFDPAVGSEAVVAAARAAEAHDAIVRLPQGYDTEVGPGGIELPLSIQQRIALARATFGDPFVLLLDDPSSFQDPDGLVALSTCLRRARERGAIVFTVGNATAIIDAANLVMVLRKDGMLDFGPKDEVRQRMMERQQQQPRGGDGRIKAAAAVPATVTANEGLSE